MQSQYTYMYVPVTRMHHFLISTQMKIQNTEVQKTSIQNNLGPMAQDQ